MKFTKYFLLFLALSLSGCSSLTTTEIENERNSLDTMAEIAINKLISQDPALQSKIDNSLGYGVANMKITKVPVVGAGGGKGVFVNKTTNERLYFNVGRFDFGGGWGVRAYKLLMIFNTQELVDQWKDGEWKFEAGAEASAGSVAAEGSSGSLNTDFSIHILAEAGASATVTARVIRISIDDELTNL